MSNKILSALATGALVLLLTTCSKKTNQATSSSAEPPRQEERKGEQNRPQGQGKERPNPEQIIAKMDANQDGKLSLSEVEGPLKNDFSKIDANQDGFITQEELNNAPRPQRGGRRN